MDSLFDRKEFLALAAAMPAAALTGLGCKKAGAPATTAPSKTERFAERILEDAATALRSTAGYIGDRLGIFKAMAGAGPLTVDELSRRTGLNARYLREFLGTMATGQYVEYHADRDAYSLPPEHAAVLADEESPFFMGGFLQCTVPVTIMAPKVAESFRTGKGVHPDEYPTEMWEALERVSAPTYKHSLVQKWLPAAPESLAKLQSGGSTADVGCGSGRASILIAKAFPKAQVLGYDISAASIERARANAKAAGVADRVQFEVRDGANLPAGQFDLVTTFDVVHHTADPIAFLGSIRKVLKPDGACLLADANAPPRIEDNMNAVGRTLYGISLLYCLTTGMAVGGPGMGAVVTEPMVHEAATKAGFTRFRRLPIEDPFEALYELKT